MHEVSIFLARFLILLPFSVALIFFIQKRKYRDLINIFVGCLFLVGLSQLFKILLPFKRPYINLGLTPPIWDFTQGTFFSTHSAVLFFLGAYFWKVNRPISLFIFLIGFIVAFLRVYIGVHYSQDVLAGGLIGILFGYIIFKYKSSFRFLN